MIARGLALVATCALAAGCGCPCDPRREAAALAGSDAVDCGFVALGEDPEPALVCAESAITEGRAFHVGVQRLGLDSEVHAYAIGRADGGGLVLHFDGDPSGGGGACPRLTAQRCAGPFVRTSEGVTVGLGCETTGEPAASLCDR